MNSRLRAKLSVAALSTALWTGGCGTATTGNPGAPGDSVVTPAVVSASFQSLAGGFGPAVPDGAACDPGKWTYAITLATHDVTWTGCAVNGPATDPGSYATATVDHAVDASHWPAVRYALEDVIVSTNFASCGADKNSEILTTQTATGSLTYGDDFYACLKQYQSYVVSSTLDDLYGTLNALP